MNQRILYPTDLDREVRFGTVSYDFLVRARPAWPELAGRLDALQADRFVIIADANVPSAVVESVEVAVAGVAPVTVIAVTADETLKNLAAVNTMAERAIADGVSRRSVVIALGGGLVGNVAGLLAALLFRGVRLVHLPTTLLGMSDSVLSLKQAVNTRLGKNHLGTFHPPQLVWCQLDFLQSVSPDETRSALCEMIKNVLAIVPERYDEVAALLRADGRYPSTSLVTFIDLCIDAKSKVMADDQLEKAEALILEYGHTIGHAAELLTGGRIPHGYAVGLGMLAAARISRELGLLDRNDEAAHRTLLERNGAPTLLPSDVSTDEVLRIARLDNKRGYVPGRADAYDFVLLEGLGRPFRPGGTFITQVDSSTVRAGVESLVVAGSALASVV